MFINHFTTPEGKTFTFNTDSLCSKDGNFYKVSKRLKNLNPHIDFDYLAHDLKYRGLLIANDISGMLHNNRKYFMYERLLLDSADNTGFEDCHYYNSLNTDKDKAHFIHGRLMAEYGWHFERNGNLQKTVSEWLQGLALDLPYYYEDILKLRSEFEGRGLTLKEQEKTCEAYWDFMAIRLINVFKAFNIGT